MNDSVRYWIATAPIGASSVLAEELGAFGGLDIRERSHDVKFQGTLEAGYRACLWSRTATRVLLSLGSVEAGTTEALFEGLKRFDWREHLAPGATLACECSGGNAAIRHTIYGSQLLKDAVCDNLRESTGERPVIRPDRPDVLLHLHVEGPTALVSVDFSGESLHRRGYRTEGGRAPLKENVAAAVLLRAGWPHIAAEGGALVDPMCGSGTFLTEAALIASDAAPALDRDYFGFLGWRGHDSELWRRLREEASIRRAARTPGRCIVGSDIDAEAVRMAIANAGEAGVAEWVHVEKRPLDSVVPPHGPAGLLVANPPYGERIGAESALPDLYAELGRLLRERFHGWQAAILTGDPPLARHLGVYAKRTHRVFNGAIECRLLRFDLTGENERPSPGETRAKWSARPGAQMFANRVRKNLDRLEPWAAKEGIECFRLYDADMPEYAFAIDIYGRDPRHVYVQEYAPPKTVDQESARQRRREVLTVLPEALGVPLERVHSRIRKAQKGAEQYQRRSGRPQPRSERSPAAAGASATTARRVKVSEGGLEFWVNFRDYLDTGLFLDHRITRQLLREWARGGNFLNLFCYTGSATVYAAAGGARSSVSVDLSSTYLDWAHDNLVLNGFGGREHAMHRADCLEWVASQEADGARFDLIFVDPPTFSNSKRMEGVLDVQRDHVGMIRRSLNLLRPAGRLVFSTNYTRFKLDADALADVEVDDISARTLPKDFERNPHIHRCFVIRPRGAR
ncbi:MAG TPA: bifunctional 23S rRNA (guanine(2069)-N(7))-methyltransferase RlmK/23S rRNA (guanine(2445)-N(2))-methyltransferase RlmL [Steroidobacteraceae bacterium]